MKHLGHSHNQTKNTHPVKNQNYLCRSFLSTLDQRNLSNGAAEMLKMACVKDSELFHMLENYGKTFVEDKFQVSLCRSHVLLTQAFAPTWQPSILTNILQI